MKPITSTPREFLAWIVLACALLMLGFSFSFAQDKKDSGKGTIHIKIQKEENGKKTKLDTTITEDQLPALKEHLKDLEIDFDSRGFSYGKGEGKGRIYRHHSLNSADMEKLNEDLAKLGKELKELDGELKDMHFEMYGFEDGSHYNFEMLIPPTDPNAPKPKVHGFYFDDGDMKRDHSKPFKFRFHALNESIPDSLNDDEHVVVIGEKGEERPEFEREITGKNGEKIFIFKRKLPKEEAAKSNPGMRISRVKVYPNPGDGRISMSFYAGIPGDVLISLTDANGKEVFTETLKGFSGEFSKEIDVTSKSKGAYFLKISQGDDSITKKIMVE